MDKRPKRRKAGTRATIDMDSIVAKVVDHYLSSDDFNGLPVRTLFTDDASREAIRSALRHLVAAGQLALEFGQGHPNPYIKAFPSPPAEEQLAALEQSDLQFACAYPTAEALSIKVAATVCQDRPFTRRLMLGEPQLAFHAFDLSVLEYYRNDPRYYYSSDDIRGWISIRDAFAEPAQMHKRDQIVLQTFGFGYDESLNRAVVVFTRYLANLSPEHQQLWNAKRLDGNYMLHPDYYRNAILGEWGTKLSLFEAFTAELKHINEMTKLMGKPALFRKEFEDRPAYFAFLIRPTTKEFDDFVHLLDKMMSENINRDFFRGDIDLETEARRADGKIMVTAKGTIQLLEQWLQKKMRFPDPTPFSEMVATFKRVRKLRQHPAHKVEDSVFDQTLFQEQRQLMLDAYNAVRTIRLMLANHPAVRGYVVPEELFNGEIWDF